MKQFSLRAICQCAILVAMEIVLNRFCSINTQFLKIGLAFIPVAMAGMLYGPIGGAVVGGVSDVLGALLFPSGAFHPGFTACAVLIGATLGFFLYQNSKIFDNREKTRFFPNVLVPVVFNAVVFALFLNTLWISQLYSSKTYWGFFISRIPQELGMCVVKCIVIPLLVPLARQLRKMGFVQYPSEKKKEAQE